ncbi:MAG: leucine-rich repeat domain-containing protein, partial [Lachnospiraceae bacterium]|nr:leucine-rich repeat domain-containing protein [Lachnospiraceae bacterium]
MKKMIALLLTACILVGNVNLPVRAEETLGNEINLEVTGDTTGEEISLEVTEGTINNENNQDEVGELWETGDDVDSLNVEAESNTVQTGICGDNLTWTLDEEGTLTVSGTGEMYDRAFDDYRNQIYGLVIEEGVTSIGEYAFAHCYRIKGELDLPNSLTSIGGHAFEACHVNMTGDLLIPDNVTSIGEYAFSECKSLKGSLKLPEGIKSIGGHAFTNCTNLSGGLKIPNSVESVGEYAFSGCNGLNGELNLSDDLKSIGGHAFSNCVNLSGGLKIPNSVESVGEDAFSGCSGFTGELKLPDGLTNIGYSAFWGCSGFTGELKLPNGLTSIGEYAFYGCSGFTGELKLPNGLTSIGGYAFEGCSGFVGDLELPDGLTSIGEYAFYGCSFFTGELKLPNGLTSIGGYAFEGCSGFTGELKLPNGLTSIGGYAFGGCSGFVGELKLPEGLKSIGNSAFMGCSGLSGELKLPEGLKSIRNSAFRGCSSLTGELKLPEGLESIGESAFRGCSGFAGEVLTLPESVTSIGAYAFYIRTVAASYTTETEWIVDVYIPAQIEQIGTHAFDQPTTIHAIPGSYAETYAKENGYPFEEWDGRSPEERMEEEAEAVEEAVAQHLSDEFEQVVESKTEEFVIQVLNPSGKALKGATVSVNPVIGSWRGTEIKQYTTDADGQVRLKVDKKDKLNNYVIVTVNATGMLEANDIVTLQSGKTAYFHMKAQGSEPKVVNVKLETDDTQVYLLSRSYTVDKANPNQDYKLTITTANVEEGTIDTLQLLQDGKVVAETPYAGQTTEMNVQLGKLLQEGTDVRVVGLKTGETKPVVSATLQLKVQSAAWSQLNGKEESTAIGTSFSENVEDKSVPVWGGQGFKIDTVVKQLPVKIEVKQNKVKIYIGKDTKKLIDKKTTADKSQILKTLQEKLDQKYGVSSPEIPVSANVVMGFKASVEYAGYLEGELLPGEDSVKVTGGIYGKVVGSGEIKWYPVGVKIMSVYFKGEISDKIDGTITVLIKLDAATGKTDLTFTPQITNTLGVKITIGALLGKEDVIGVKGEGELGVSWKHRFIPVGTEPQDTVDLKGGVKVEGFLKVAWHDKDIFKAEKTFWKWEDTHRLYPKQADANALSVQKATEEEEPFYPYSDSRLVTCGGVEYLFYIEQREERNAADAPALMYRTNKGAGWSQAQYVDDDGTADTDFDLVTDGNKIYVVWQNVGGSLQELTTEEQALKNIGLKTATISTSGVTGVKQIDTTDSLCPFAMHILYADG